jgi:hypothetical protein
MSSAPLAPITTIRAYAGVKQLFCFRPLVDNAYPAPSYVPEATDVSGVTVTTGVVSEADARNPYAGMAFALIDGGTAGGTGNFTLWVNFPYIGQPIGYPVKVAFYDTVITAPPRPSVVVPPAYFSGVGAFTATVKGQKRVGDSVFSGVGGFTARVGGMQAVPSSLFSGTGGFNASVKGTKTFPASLFNGFGGFTATGLKGTQRVPSSPFSGAGNFTAGLKGVQKVPATFAGFGGFVATVAAVPITVPTLARVDSNTPVAGDEELYEITNFSSYASTFSFSASATGGTAAVYGKYVLWKTPNTTTTETLSVNAITQYGGVSNSATASLTLTADASPVSIQPTLLGSANIELNQPTTLRIYNEGRYPKTTAFKVLTTNAPITQIGGRIMQVRPVVAGSGYSTATPIFLNIPAPSNPLGRQAVVQCHVDSAGTINYYEVLDCGSGYDNPITATVPAPSSGTTATCFVRLRDGSGISHAEITNYGIATASTVPTLTCPAPDITGGTQATLTAVMARGVVSVTQSTTGFSTEKPVITATGGAGSATWFDCDWNSSTGAITNIRPLQFGSSYTSAPTLSYGFIYGGTMTTTPTTTCVLGWYLQGVNVTNAGEGYVNDFDATVSGGAFTTAPVVKCRTTNGEIIEHKPTQTGTATLIVQAKEVGKRKSPVTIKQQTVLQSALSTHASIPALNAGNYPLMPHQWSPNTRVNPSYTGALLRAIRLSDNATMDIDENTSIATFLTWKGTSPTYVDTIYSQYGTQNIVNPAVTASGINAWSLATNGAIVGVNPHTGRISVLMRPTSRLVVPQLDLRNVYVNGTQINSSGTPPTGMGLYALVTPNRTIGGTGNTQLSALCQWHTYRRSISTGGNLDTSINGMTNLSVLLEQNATICASNHNFSQTTTAGNASPSALQGVSFPSPVVLQAGETALLALDIFGASHASGNNVLRLAVNGHMLERENDTSGSFNSTWANAGYALSSVRLNGDTGTTANTGDLEIGSYRLSGRAFAVSATNNDYWLEALVFTGQLTSASGESAERRKMKLGLHLKELFQGSTVSTAVNSNIKMDFRNKTIASNAIAFDAGNLTLNLNNVPVASFRTNDNSTGATGDTSSTTGTPRVYTPNLSIGTTYSGFKALLSGKDPTKTNDIAGSINPALATSNIANRARASGSGLGALQACNEITMYYIGQKAPPRSVAGAIVVTDYQLTTHVAVSNATLNTSSVSSGSISLHNDHGMPNAYTGAGETFDPNLVTRCHVDRDLSYTKRPVSAQWLADNKGFVGTGGLGVFGYLFKLFMDGSSDGSAQFNGYANAMDAILRNGEIQKGAGFDYKRFPYETASYLTPAMFFHVVKVKNKAGFSRSLLSELDTTKEYYYHLPNEFPLRLSTRAIEELTSATVEISVCPMGAPNAWKRMSGAKAIKQNAVPFVPDSNHSITFNGNRNSHPQGTDSRIGMEFYFGCTTEQQDFDKYREWSRLLINDTFV